MAKNVETYIDPDAHANRSTEIQDRWRRVSESEVLELFIAFNMTGG